MSRLTSAQADAVIESFVARATDDRESLLKVCLSRGDELAVAPKYVIEQTNLNPATISKRASSFEPIFDAMRAEGIIVPGHPPTACDWRRRLLAWYEGMSMEEKLAIPVTANTIIHRNTIRQRDFPAQRLEAIKDNRRIAVLAQRVKAEKKQDPKTILMQRLEKSRLEVLYWFNRYQESENSCATLDKRLDTVRESRDYFVQVADELRKKIKEQETEILKLRDALDLVSANLEEPK